tara:strand:- start:7367 stop:7789 length:423 start_codon:yes stop_codon:yes gene_type:complete
MESQLKHNANHTKKSLKELLHNCNLWTADLEFIKIEIAFLKTLLATYPFKASIPNLFEKLQLFSKDLENLETLRTIIHKTIHSHIQALNKNITISELDYSSTYQTSYNALTEDVFAYFETYKNLKIKIYEFITGLINNKS